MKTNSHLHSMSLFGHLAARPTFMKWKDQPDEVSGEWRSSSWRYLFSFSLKKKNPPHVLSNHKEGLMWLSNSLCGETEQTLRSVCWGRTSKLTRTLGLTPAKSLFKWSPDVHIPVIYFCETLLQGMYNLKLRCQEQEGPAGATRSWNQWQPGC